MPGIEIKFHLKRLKINYFQEIGQGISNNVFRIFNVKCKKKCSIQLVFVDQQINYWLF